MKKLDGFLILLLISLAAYTAWLWADNQAMADHNRQLSKENEQLTIQIWDLKQYLTNNE